VTPGHETEATMTFSAANLLQLAQSLCAPFGVTVTEPSGEGTPIIDVVGEIGQFAIALNRSAFDVGIPTKPPGYTEVMPPVVLM
jgi:hypothetical protein